MQPTKWDSQAKRIRKRLSKREKIALLQSYESQLHQGRNREKILTELTDKIGVTSQRQVERILAQAKEYNRGTKKHYTDLSVTALKLASNLESYLDNLERYVNYSGTDLESTIGNVVYGGWLPDIDEINERNYLADLMSIKGHKVNKPVAPERTDIKDAVKVSRAWPKSFWLNDGDGPERSVKMYEVNKSVALNLLYHLKDEFPELIDIDDWADLTGDEISYDFIARLKLKANREDFMGKCPACPC